MGLLDTQNIYNLVGRLNYTKTQIDDALSMSSINPVQNNIITAALSDLQRQIDDLQNQITDIIEGKVGKNNEED